MRLSRETSLQLHLHMDCHGKGVGQGWAQDHAELCPCKCPPCTFPPLPAALLNQRPTGFRHPKCCSVAAALRFGWPRCRGRSTCPLIRGLQALPGQGMGHWGLVYGYLLAVQGCCVGQRSAPRSPVQAYGPCPARRLAKRNRRCRCRAGLADVYPIACPSVGGRLLAAAPACTHDWAQEPALPQPSPAERTGEDIAHLAVRVGIPRRLAQLLRQRQAAVQVAQRTGWVTCSVHRGSGAAAGPVRWTGWGGPNTSRRRKRWLQAAPTPCRQWPSCRVAGQRLRKACPSRPRRMLSRRQRRPLAHPSLAALAPALGSGPAPPAGLQSPLPAAGPAET